jgi:Ca2+-binding EF-hand superfamily protein
METHIRKLFDLFDINKTGYLSLQEITGRIHLILFFFCFFFH